MIDLIVRYISHLTMIGITYELIISLFDWKKLTKQPVLNNRKLKLFILFISISIGFMVSNFIVTIIEMTQKIILSL